MLRAVFLSLVSIGLAFALTACAGEAPETSLPDPPYAVIAAEQELSQEINMPVDEIDYVSYSREDWPDACLGLAEPGEMCAQVITPGWEVILEAEGQEYVYRTDQNGDVVRREE